MAALTTCNRGNHKAVFEFVKSDSKYNAGIWNSSPRRYTEIIIMLSVKDLPAGIIIARFSQDEMVQAVEFAFNISAKLDVPVNNFLPSNLFKSL